MTDDRPICDRKIETVGERVIIRDEYGHSQTVPVDKVNPRRLWRWLRWKTSDWRTG